MWHKPCEHEENTLVHKQSAICQPLDKSTMLYKLTLV